MAELPNDQKPTNPTRKRGRKVGSTLHPLDLETLLHVAQLLNTGQADTPGKVFSELAGDDTNALRRWHRKWKAHGASYLKEERRRTNSRCDLEYRSLRESTPILWARIKSFERSNAGQKYLKSFARGTAETVHPMSLPIWTLMKEVEAYEKSLEASATLMNGNQPDSSALEYEGEDTMPPATTRFDNAIDAWLGPNVPVSSGALRILATMTTALADKIDAARRTEA